MPCFSRLAASFYRRKNHCHAWKCTHHHFIMYAFHHVRISSCTHHDFIMYASSVHHAGKRTQAGNRQRGVHRMQPRFPRKRRTRSSRFVYLQSSCCCFWAHTHVHRAEHGMTGEESQQSCLCDTCSQTRWVSLRSLFSSHEHHSQQRLLTHNT